MELTYLLTAASLFESFEAGAEKLKQKALDEYAAALLMPRKKKKKAKKSAITLYEIACYRPFQH